MLKILLFLGFLQLCFCQCPPGTESSLTNPKNCYIFVAEKLNFITAEEYCRQNVSGHLTSVASAFDNLFLSSRASSYFSNNTDGDFWIGGTNELIPGNWSWVDGTPFTYADWMKGQPGNTSAPNCASSSITTSLWSAVDCFQQKPFVCMFPATSTTTTTTTTTTMLPTTTTKRIPSCQGGWSSFDTTGFCYRPFSSAGINWQDAENYCVRYYNSHLASIHSQLESDYVGDLVRSNARGGNDPCKYNQIWIGLYTVTSGQSWMWTDGTPYDFAGWSPTEPNGGGSENCVQLMLYNCQNDNMDYWNDIGCAYNMNHFVCKKPKS